MALFSSVVLFTIECVDDAWRECSVYHEYRSICWRVGWTIYRSQHRGKKPSFFKDLQFLMIGPAWLMGFILKRMGIGY